MNTVFFYLSKILWTLLSPASFLFLLLIAGIALLFLNKIHAARILLGSAAVLMTLVTFLPLGKWLVTPLEAHFPANPTLPESIDGIIMLGGAIDPVNSYIWDQPQLGSAADRYTAFIALARTYPDARLVFTGGSGSIIDQEFREADIALYFLESMGIERRRLEVERDARNTFENAVNSEALINPTVNEQWVLITSAAHMPRSVGTFCKQGWPVIPYPVDHESSPGRQIRIQFDFAGNLDSFNTHIREWLGLLVYYFIGRTDQILPDGCL
ncbi:MAG: YdcF family protein [Gammaproteobacteria bacterium]|nr:YdcF family protein [Gammaproteobacteria bacterium]